MLLRYNQKRKAPYLERGITAKRQANLASQVQKDPAAD